MQRALRFLAPVLLISAALPARAAILDVTFSGPVTTEQNAAFTVGQTISGEFLYRTDTNQYLSFTIGGTSIQPPYTSSANLAVDEYTALYQAQSSPVATGGSTNSTYTLDLEAIGVFPVTGNSTADAVSLLTNTSQLATNLDPSSDFGFYNATASGTNVTSVTAALTTLKVAVPEPATLALIMTSIAGLGFLRRRS